MSDLAKRLAAHEHWKWMPGMMALGAGPNLLFGRCCSWFPLGRTANTLYQHPKVMESEYRLIDPVPDLEDAATQGALWSMLVEACEHAVTLGIGPNLTSNGRVWWYTDAQGNRDSRESIALALLHVWGEA